MKIIINNTSMIPVYEQLMDQIKQEIIGGGLKEGDALPSVRNLAGELRISALTVKKAYDKLEEDGFTVTVHGKGIYAAGARLLRKNSPRLYRRHAPQGWKMMRSARSLRSCWRIHKQIRKAES